MNLGLTPRLFTLFRILVQPRWLAWTLQFVQILPFFNWFRCTVQLVRLTNTGNLSSAPVLQVLPVSLPQPVSLVITQVASSTAPGFQTRQTFCQRSQTASSKHPTLVLSAGPTTGPTAVPPTQVNNSDPSPQAGDQGYVSPLIDLYLERDSNLEALYEDSLADREPVSYEDVLDALSGSEADPAESESIHSRDQNSKETVLQTSLVGNLSGKSLLKKPQSSPTKLPPLIGASTRSMRI